MATHTTPSHSHRRFIKLTQVKNYTSLSTSEIYRRIAAGTFPPQVQLGPKSVAWVEAEIISWLDSVVAQRE
ncbi:AlpA family transcriptional regulator [Pseudomonas aeruginosa]|uniref:helix-turn-helix transcriptional regulator n=1 Tax=Pseudomonas aeruginosa TaxID=287 RepID=UPI000D65019D|nr:AlpA family transcriptional regulator [Pseudomonas aeruginosa]MBG4243740.1 AlpA family transcriptional regulator [Pseudomonas aeruginosa]MBX5648251.1 AlpA family transcriptional regulator [Pseudomonas aeruginosa]MCG0479133.1 AlpA family transcriptional regulator [Pseudomonas aeruginosa]MCO3750922.1 AlpA family transcriptional regulator [Pseudomonas aeruginosa]MCV4091997.1 AlpA family transcriptional regulator [Pseudomonas aeruginosa]